MMGSIDAKGRRHPLEPDEYQHAARDRLDRLVAIRQAILDAGLEFMPRLTTPEVLVAGLIEERDYLRRKQGG